MRVDDCYSVGKLIKTHGLKGELVLKFDVDFPEEYENMESMLVMQNDVLVPFFISGLRMQSDRAIVALEDIKTIESAKPLAGCDVYLPLSNLPKLPEGGYYFHELIGCEVFHDQEKIGVIMQLFQPSSQYLAQVVEGDREILIPVTDEIFVQVDTGSRRIDVNLPDGLLDIYN
jgi:16S rRNA processing protein RimM